MKVPTAELLKACELTGSDLITRKQQLTITPGQKPKMDYEIHQIAAIARDFVGHSTRTLAHFHYVGNDIWEKVER
jgi:hypothetical protein